MTIRDLQFVRSIVEECEGVEYRFNVYQSPGYSLVVWHCPICDPSEPCAPAANAEEVKAIEECRRNMQEHHCEFHSLEHIGWHRALGEYPNFAVSSHP